MAWYRVDKDGGNDPLLSARECAAAALYKGKVLITNGNDASTRFKDTLEFDPRTLTVHKHAAAQNAAQVPVSAHTFTTCDGRMYYQFGGWDGSRDIASMFRFDAESKTWTGVTPGGDVPSARHFHTCIGLGKRIVLFGGYDGSRWTSDLFAFDPVTQTWCREAPVATDGSPSARASHHAVALDDKRMAVFAGFDGSEFLSDLWILHVTTAEGGPTELATPANAKPSYRWERVVRSNAVDYWAEPRSGGGIVYFKNHLIVYGGRCRRDGKVSFSDRVEVFSFDQMKWREVQSSGAVPAPRKCFAYAHIRDKMFIFGGLGAGTTYYMDVHCLELDSVIGYGDDGDGLDAHRIPLPHSTFAADLHALVYEAFQHVLDIGPLTNARVMAAKAAARSLSDHHYASGWRESGGGVPDGHAPAGGDEDAGAPFALASMTEGHAYTDQDFEAYFSQSAGAGAPRGLSGGYGQALAGAEPNSGAIGVLDPAEALPLPMGAYGASPVAASLGSAGPAHGSFPLASGTVGLFDTNNMGPAGGETSLTAPPFASPTHMSTYAVSSGAHPRPLIPPVVRRDQPRFGAGFSPFSGAHHAHLLTGAGEEGLSAGGASFGDVVFDLNGACVRLHKVILAARCEYFRVMFSSRWRSVMGEGEGEGDIIPMEDISLVTFWHVVHYIYTDTLPPDFDVGEHALDLLEQAQKFELVRLSYLCQRELERFIADDTVCDMLRQADLLNAMALRLACMIYILDNFERVTVQRAFIGLPENVLREVLVRRSKRMAPTGSRAPQTGSGPLSTSLPPSVAPAFTGMSPLNSTRSPVGALSMSMRDVGMSGGQARPAIPRSPLFLSRSRSSGQTPTRQGSTSTTSAGGGGGGLSRSTSNSFASPLAAGAPYSSSLEQLQAVSPFGQGSSSFSSSAMSPVGLATLPVPHLRAPPLPPVPEQQQVQEQVQTGSTVVGVGAALVVMAAGSPSGTADTANNSATPSEN